MEDAEILQFIQNLVEEEHTLRSEGEAVDRERLGSIENMLDQCWDLLRQRRRVDSTAKIPTQPTPTTRARSRATSSSQSEAPARRRCFRRQVEIASMTTVSTTSRTTPLHPLGTPSRRRNEASSQSPA